MPLLYCCASLSRNRHIAHVMGEAAHLSALNGQYVTCFAHLP
jgi:hypothetical protein